LDRLDRDSGGDLAGRMSAHAVGDDEEPQIFGADKAILVDPADGAGLTQAVCDHKPSVMGGVYHAGGRAYYFSGSDTTKVVFALLRQPTGSPRERHAESILSGQFADKQCARVDADLVENFRQMFLRRSRCDTERRRDLAVAAPAQHQFGNLALPSGQTIALPEGRHVGADLADAERDVAVAPAQVHEIHDERLVVVRRQRDGRFSVLRTILR